MPRSKLSDEERKQRRKEVHKRYRLRNAAQVAERHKRYKTAHRELLNSRCLKRRYGITTEERDAMLAAQGGVCAICRGPNEVKHDWNVDHCHSTGRVRGILCGHCNVMLGRARDNPATLSAGIDYLLANTFI